MDKDVARRLADQRLEEWRQSTTYDDVLQRDLTSSTDDRQVTEGGVTYRVDTTIWREQHDTAYTLHVKVSELNGRRFFGGSVARHGRLHPNGTWEFDS